MSILFALFRVTQKAPFHTKYVILLYDLLLADHLPDADLSRAWQHSLPVIDKVLWVLGGIGPRHPQVALGRSQGQ